MTMSTRAYDSNMSPPAPVDVARLIDTGTWSGYQKFVLVLIALAVILDGFDNQVLSLAVPALMTEWGVTRNDFAPLISLGFVGMALGTAIGGSLGDRFGRRPVLMGTVLIFGLATCLMATSDHLLTLGIFRFLGGLGLGGAMPNATALTAEMTPARRRSVAVTLIVVCVAVGGLFGSIVAAHVLPMLGWRWLFAIGGSLALLLALVQLFSLPESPVFLARHSAGSGKERLLTLLARMGHRIGRDAVFAHGAPAHEHRARIAALFETSMRRDTLALWGAFLFTLLTLYSLANWLPSLLNAKGFDLSVSSAGLAYMNFGGMIGALTAGILFDRLGSRAPLLAMSAGAVLAAAGLSQLSFSPTSAYTVTMVLLILFGACVGGIQVVLYPLAANIYAAEERATGIGWAVGIGRIGAVISPFVGAAALANNSPLQFFGWLGAFMLIVWIGIASIRRHTRPATWRSRGT